MMWQPGVTLGEVEREIIFDALKFYQGNRTHTAAALGIALRTLLNKLEKYKESGIKAPALPGELAGRQPNGCQT